MFHARARIPQEAGRLRAFEPTVGAEERTVVAAHLENFGEEALRRHAHDLPTLEERLLYFLLALRWPRVRVVVVTSLPVPEQIVDYYLGLIPEAEAPRSRMTVLSVDDDSARPLAQKILDHPDVLASLRSALEGREDGAFIMPFNVRDLERELALTLGVPIYGVDHRYAAYGTKSGARRVFSEAGVPHPAGESDLHGSAEIAAALRRLRAQRPQLEAAVLKLNDAFYGEGNRVVRLRDLPRPGTPDERAELDVRVRTLPRSYLVEFAAAGGIAEEMIGGEIRSPSVQLRILPGGQPLIVSMHDQVLGGRRRANVRRLSLPGRRCIRRRHHGRSREGWRPSRTRRCDWPPRRRLRRRQTRRRLAALRARDQPARGRNLASVGNALALDARVARPARNLSSRVRRTEALLRHRRTFESGLPADRTRQVPEGILSERSGLRRRSTDRAVYHMLTALQTQGRISVVAIGDSPEHADDIYLRIVRLLDELSGATH